MLEFKIFVSCFEQLDLFNSFWEWDWHHFE
jgi:hypothetical protein